MPPFTGDKFTRQLDDLTVGLSRVMFPIVVLLGLNGLVVGILNSIRPLHDPGARAAGLEPRDHRRLVALTPLFRAATELYAYAIGVLAGTIVQFSCRSRGCGGGLHLRVTSTGGTPAIAAS